MRAFAEGVAKIYRLLEQNGIRTIKAEHVIEKTGVEGYIESTSSGFVAGVNAAMNALGKEEIDFTKETIIGALAHYVNDGAYSGNFQPMNANFGIVAPLAYKVKGGKKARNEEIAKRALSVIEEIKDKII